MFIVLQVILKITYPVWLQNTFNDLGSTDICVHVEYVGSYHKVNVNVFDHKAYIFLHNIRTQSAIFHGVDTDAHVCIHL